MSLFGMSGSSHRQSAPRMGLCVPDERSRSGVLVGRARTFLNLSICPRGDALQVKDRINALSERQRELEGCLTRTEPAPVLIHPSMAHRYQVWVRNLIESLNEPEQRENSIALICNLIEKIVLTPKADCSGLTVDLYGDLAGILQASVGRLPGDAKTSTPPWWGCRTAS